MNVQDFSIRYALRLDPWKNVRTARFSASIGDEGHEVSYGKKLYDPLLSMYGNAGRHPTNPDYICQSRGCIIKQRVGEFITVGTGIIPPQPFGPLAGVPNQDITPYSGCIFTWS